MVAAGSWLNIVLNLRQGSELEFQAEIGDGGECFGCYGPYQLRDGESAYSDETVTGESW